MSWSKSGYSENESYFIAEDVPPLDFGGPKPEV
jgi:hypothetical protein